VRTRRIGHANRAFLFLPTGLGGGKSWALRFARPLMLPQREPYRPHFLADCWASQPGVNISVRNRKGAFWDWAEYRFPGNTRPGPRPNMRLLRGRGAGATGSRAGAILSCRLSQLFV